MSNKGRSKPSSLARFAARNLAVCERVGVCESMKAIVSYKGTDLSGLPISECASSEHI